MKIELRIPTIADKEDLKKLCNAVDRSYLSDRLPYPYTDEAADWWINTVTEKDGKEGVWRLIYVDDVLAGNASVEMMSDVYRKDSEIGYMLLTEYWGKGIATEVAKQMCILSFDQLDICRITGLCYSPNVASRRVMEKAGFVQEGLKKKAVFKSGNLYDLVIMGLVKDA